MVCRERWYGEGERPTAHDHGNRHMVCSSRIRIAQNGIRTSCPPWYWCVIRGNVLVGVVIITVVRSIPEGVTLLLFKALNSSSTDCRKEAFAVVVYSAFSKFRRCWIGIPPGEFRWLILSLEPLLLDLLRWPPIAPSCPLRTN
ncbi:hypothetical protein L3X38_010222 [Prunus dulcis]|uniref:Uncharacterized protein n=1 Tax=Prunus dulcis TaxID=3755 RepID=A0AAD4WHV2_PRUDU|nr:hypothetical protein L3X38_010222 [Prunus dulcis]